MRRLSIYLAWLLLTATVTQLSGCRKLIDVLFHDHGHQDKTCNIKRFGQRTGFGELLMYADVSYNEKGNPVSVIFDSLNNITPWHFFEYDGMNRLVEYRVEWGPGREFYKEIHHYGYSDEGLITIDTAYLEVEGTFNLIYYLEYDDQDRVVKQDEYILHDDGTTSYFRTLNFEYGTDGNLIVENKMYDDKPSFIATNKTWQFISRDYSNNNVAGALTYNENGLPLTFDEPNGGSFLGNSTPAFIEYECE